MVWFAIAALGLAAAALVVAYLTVSRSQEISIRAHNDAKELAKAALEAQYKYGPLVMQTAAALLERENNRVNARVKTINALVNGQAAPEESTPPAPVGEAPAMGVTGMVDDLHEIQRDLGRIRREDVPPEIVREPGVGEDRYATAGDGTVMQDGKPLEI